MKSLRMVLACLALPAALSAQQPQANPITAAAPAGAQSDERTIVAAVTKFLDGIRARDTSLMRSTIVAGATYLPVGGPTGLGAPSAVDAIIERTGRRLQADRQVARTGH